MIKLLKQSTFVAFSMPGHTDHELYVHDGKGKQRFVIAPFKNKERQKFIIRSQKLPKNSVFSFLDIEDMKMPHVFVESKAEYLESVAKIKELAQKGIIEKLVYSRILEFKNQSINVYSLFEAAKIKYPDQFVYLMHVPNHGLWMGVSPELLLEQTNNSLKTVALAGTMKRNSNGDWTEKEYEEQNIIKRYYKRIFNEYNISYTVDHIKTVTAGDVVHLKNNYSLSTKINAEHLVNLIYPSPAICGTPYPKSLDYIYAYELHDREYYCGYMGPIYLDSLSFFINIRCMRIFSNGSHLYVGGGITKNSDPKQEWEETELKAKTLLSILQGGHDKQQNSQSLNMYW